MKLEDLKDMTPEQIVAAYAALEQENAELAEGKGAAEKLVKTYELQTAEQAEATRKAGNAAWIESVADGKEPKMLPAERPLATYLLDVLTVPAGTTVKAYTEKAKDGDKEIEVEVSPAEAFKRLYTLRDKGVVAQLFTESSTSTSTENGGEPAKPKTVEEANALATERAKEYANANKVPFAKAYRTVLDGDPELKALVAGVRPEGQAKALEGAAHFARVVAEK